MSLFHTVKTYFIPCAHNGFRPRVLATSTFLILIGAVIGLKLVSVVSFSIYTGANLFHQVSQTDLYALTNQTRSQYQLKPLTPNPRLETAAQLKLADMTSQGYFAHVSPKGVEPWYWFDRARYDYSIAGENLAMDFTTTNEVMNGWLNSELHRKNILLASFTEIGIAVGTGVIEDDERTVVVQLFGSPRGAVSVLAANLPVQTGAPVPTPVPQKPVPPALTPFKTPFKKLVPTPTPTPAPTSPATAFRTESSRPIALVNTAEASVPEVQGASFVDSAPYISHSLLNLIFMILILASVAVFLINLLVVWRIQYPALILKSAALVGICLLAVFANDAWVAEYGSRVIIP